MLAYASFLPPIPACYCGDGFPWLLTHRSIGRLVSSATPIVLPIRGHLDSIKQLMLGDLYIGRGSRQRGLKKSLWCNPFKVSQHGRALAVSKFEHHLRTDQDLNEAPVFSERFPDAYDRDSGSGKPPTARVRSSEKYLSRVDEEAPERGAGWMGHGPPMEVGVGYVSRELCDGQSLASPEMVTRATQVPTARTVEGSSQTLRELR